MITPFKLREAARLLNSGAVVLLPTDTIYGLSCLPDDESAVAQLLALKRRPPAKGLILLGASHALFRGYCAPLTVDEQSVISNNREPTTWVVPAARTCPPLLSGGRTTVAIRITTHPVCAALSQLLGCPLVSTSANISGRPAARTPWIARRLFDIPVISGRCGGTQPSCIRVLHTNTTLRHAQRAKVLAATGRQTTHTSTMAGPGAVAS